MVRFSSFLRQLYRRHAGLAVVGAATALLTALFALFVLTDPRLIGGQPAWMKPLKFAVSISLYSLTLVWLLGFVDTTRPWRQRLVRALGWVIAVAFVLEMVPITWQVVRGTTSHFNVATPFDLFWWSVMGAAIMVLWGAHLGLTLLLLAQRRTRPAFDLALRLGLGLTLVGMAQGFLMTSPTAQQLASWRTGEPVTVAGAHTVGLPDGGPGLPVTGWSTQGGDLRVGHFVGMHALQVLPFLGWALSRRRRLSEAQRQRLVWVAGTGYLGLTVLLTWQALRAQPLLSPDALTLAAAAALLIATGVAVALALRTSASLRPLEVLP